MSMLLCPVCSEPLGREERRYLCSNHHCFDLSKEGYVHLLTSNRMHSKAPGDDKGMAAARNRFLSGEYYAPLREALQKLAVEYTSDRPAVLDSGCGEGYYTAGIAHALSQAGRGPSVTGIDISKFSLRWAAKRSKEVEFAVASAYHLPVAGESIDLLVNCFSPLGLEEFTRVLKPGGVFLYVVPARRHLWQLKEVLYDRPYENTEERIEYEGFRYEEVVQVREVIRLPDTQSMLDLFQMTPYYWRTPRSGLERLKTLDTLDTEIAFDIHVLRRK